MGDFDEQAISFYKAYYGQRLLSKGNVYLYSHSGKSIEVRGDVCFNLNIKNGKFFTLYGSIIREDKNFGYLDEYLQKIRYSPMNISIMPKTGGLNNIKKNVGNDRFDIFASLLWQYYNNQKAPIINSGARNMLIGQRVLLSEFLDSYMDVYDFFKDVYGLNESFTKEMVEKGRYTIVSKSDFYEYISLALRFWNIRIRQKNINKYLEKDKIERYKKAMNSIEEIIKMNA